MIDSCSSSGPLAWIQDKLMARERHGLRRRLLVREGPRACRLTLAQKDLVDFSSNDYLGLAGDPQLITAASCAAAIAGWGSGASPLITGRGALHAQLEARLASFEGTEAALLFPSGFAANSGTIPALVGKGDAIYSDAKNHASIIDGCRLSAAHCFVYRHGDTDQLASLLCKENVYRRRLIVTDSLFSMDGDLAPIDRIAELAQQHSAMLMVDEAHATGVFGPRGRGVVEHCAETHRPSDLQDLVHIRVGTLSKALGSAGGFVCGSQLLIDWLSNNARSYVFSTAQPEAASAAALAALDIVEHEPQRRTELLQRAADLRCRLQQQGWDIGRSVSQIIPLVIGDAGQTMHLAVKLRDQGYLVPPIRPPSVPAGQSQLRLSLCWNHTSRMIDGLVWALESLRRGL